jgi:hypothetical protein
VAAQPYVFSVLPTGAAGSPSFLPLQGMPTPRPGVFGFHIPFLPDLDSDPALLNADAPDRLAAALERWRTIVAELWKWRRCAFALRLLSIPERGEIALGLLVRVAEGAEVAPTVAADLVRLLARAQIPLQPLQAATELQTFLDPYPWAPLVEVRQAEQVEPLQLGDAYVVYRCWAAAGDWLALFDTLIRQRSPLLVNIHLEPTALTEGERGMIQRAASVAAHLADFQFDGMYHRGVRIPDPQAELLSRIYAANGRRLHEPYLVTVQVTGSDWHAISGVAGALGTAMTTRPRQAREEEGTLPAYTQLHLARTAADRAAANQTLTSLWLTDWGPTQAGADQVRLRYLVDAQGASAIFRLPTALGNGIPGVASRRVLPAAHRGPQQVSLAQDELLLGRMASGGLVTVPREHLVRHALIAGFTRSGKTNTCLNILGQLWCRHHVPFLVLEPVKTEYRGLLGQPGFADLLVFTLGDEAVAPFRLNPFELLPGIRLEAHIGELRACFDAALPQFGVLPMLIEEAIHTVYQRLGWRLTDRQEEQPARPFPTLADLHGTLKQAVQGYAGEVRQNLETALSKRVGSLLRGSKGRMFNTRRGIPLDLLMRRPVVLELEKLSADEQPLTMLFLLMFVREYRRIHRARTLCHVTLIEEAHLVMSATAPVSNPEIAANTRAEGAQAFERLLAEIGGLGEGVIIAEQSPAALVAGAINNTGLKIAHQMLGQGQIETIGGAMIMDERQRQQVQRLRVGEAAVFMSGDEQATFMAVPPYKRDHEYDDFLPESAVSERMRAFQAQHPDAILPFPGCQFCQSRCRYRPMIADQTRDPALHWRFAAAWQRVEPLQSEHTGEAAQARREFVAVAADAARQAGRPGALDAAWCYWVQQVDESFVFRRGQRDWFAATASDLAHSADREGGDL